jgi:hypothetical protein
MPILILLLIILPEQRRRMTLALKKQRKRGIKMNNELIKTYIERVCTVSSGFGSAVKGKIVRVQENWIEIETKGGIQLVNAEFVTQISVHK